MEIPLAQTNLGRLKGRIEDGNNIIYYRRGLEELSLNITNECPNSCVFCIRDRDAGWGVSNLYLTSNPSVKEIIDEFDIEASRLKDEGVKLERVKICGYGEPLIRFDDLFPITKYVRENYPDIQIQLATTGWPFYRFSSGEEQALKDLKDAGMTHIFLSLNATNQERYAKIVRPGIEEPDSRAHSDAIRFAEATRDYGYDVTLGFVNLPGTNENEVKSLANKLGLKYRLREFED